MPYIITSYHLGMVYSTHNNGVFLGLFIIFGLITPSINEILYTSRDGLYNYNYHPCLWSNVIGFTMVYQIRYEVC